MDRPLEVEQTFLRGAAERSPVRISSAAKVPVPRVEVGIEVDQREGPEARCRRPQQRKRDGVVATKRENVRCMRGDQLRGIFDLSDRLLDAEGSARDVAGVRNLPSERLRISPRVERPQHP